VPLLARVLLLSVVMLPALPRSMRAGIRYCVCAGSSFESGKDQIVEEEGWLHDAVWGFAVLGQIADDRVGTVEHVEKRNGRGDETDGHGNSSAWYMLADGLDAEQHVAD
jgi:hypothetical protein